MGFRGSVIILTLALSVFARHASAEGRTLSKTTSKSEILSIQIADPAVPADCKTKNGCGANQDPNREIVSCEVSADGKTVKFTLKFSSGITHTMECFDFDSGGCSCL